MSKRSKDGEWQRRGSYLDGDGFISTLKLDCADIGDDPANLALANTVRLVFDAQVVELGFEVAPAGTPRIQSFELAEVANSKKFLDPLEQPTLAVPTTSQRACPKSRT